MVSGSVKCLLKYLYIIYYGVLMCHEKVAKKLQRNGVIASGGNDNSKALWRGGNVNFNKIQQIRDGINKT